MHRLYQPLLAVARAAEVTATDRLVAAWQQGAQIPPRDEPTVGHVVEALPEVVAEYVNQFDDAGRAVYETKARSLIEQQLEPHEVLARLDLLRFQRREAFA